MARASSSWACRVASFALALAAIPACSREAPPTAHVTAASDSPEYAIVWGDSPLGVRSYWIELSHGQARVIAQLRGALFLSQGRLYRWHPLQRIQHVLNVCPDSPEPNGEDSDQPKGAATPDDSQRAITVYGAEAERLDAEGHVRIVNPPDVEHATSFGNTVELLGSVGSLLFIGDSTDALYCDAAHGLSSYSRDTFDLVKGEFTPPTKAELAELRELALRSQRAALLACLAQRSNADGQPYGADALEQLELNSAQPVLSASGQLAFELDLSFMHSYVEGVVSCPVTVEMRKPPPRFAPPRALAKFRELEPKTQVHGWSTLAPGEQALVPTISRVFAERAQHDE